MRVNAIVNSVAVALLIVFAATVISLVQSRYSRLSERQDRLEASLRDFESTVDRVDQSLRRYSVTTEDALLRLSNGLSGLSKLLSEKSALLSTTKDRVAALESSYDIADDGQQRDATSPYSKLRDAFEEACAQPVELPPELRRKVDGFAHAGTIGDWDFEMFLKSIVEADFLPFDEVSAVPSDLSSRIHLEFDVYAAYERLLSAQRTLEIAGLVDAANANSDYHEVPADDPEAGQRYLDSIPKSERKGVLQSLEIADRGVTRIYLFPYQRYPELMDHWTYRDNARDHLMHNVSALCRDWPQNGGREIGE